MSDIDISLQIDSERSVEQLETPEIAVDDRIGLIDFRAELARDVRHGLAMPQKELPPRYFYDDHGSRLFEQICELPEYYQTRTEQSILDRLAPDLALRYAPVALVEFGSGSSSKTRTLISAMRDVAAGSSTAAIQYAPIDVSREILVETSRQLLGEYPGIVLHPVIADFNDGLPSLELERPMLVMFLGSTIGNLRDAEAEVFLRRVASGMRTGDIFLLGLDLVKNPLQISAAYNDALGVTAEFNLNVLRVINRELGGTFDPATFVHYSFYNPEEQQIEMHLASLVQQAVRIEAIDTTVTFGRGETILTEISRKFTRAGAASLLQRSGFELMEWHTDPEELFALCVARPHIDGR